MEEREEGIEARALRRVLACLGGELGGGASVAPRRGIGLALRIQTRVGSGAVHRRGGDELTVVVGDEHRNGCGGVLHDETDEDQRLRMPHAAILTTRRSRCRRLDFEPMRAIVIEKPNAVALREVETPTPDTGEVRVRSVRAGVCRTDLDIVAGTLDPRWVRFPVVPGHEWSGVVDSVGDGVIGLEPGDRVVCEGNIACLRCARCRAGDTHLCASYDAVGFTRSGGYGEFVVVPARVVHVLPGHVSFDAAVLVEPGAVVLKALERARIEPGETVGVVGVGALGAIAIRLARLRSPATIVAYGLRAEELELALALGADSVVSVADVDAEVETRKLAGGGLDVVVETAGAVAAFELSTRLTREGGRIVALGIAGHGHELTLPSDRIALRDLSVFGSVGYTTAAWARMVDLLRERLVDLDPIVTYRFPLERFEDAFALMDDRRGVVAKIVLEHAV